MLPAVVLALVNLGFIGQLTANATSVTHASIRLTRMAAGQNSNLRVEFQATGGATGFTIDFNGADSTTWTGSSGSIHSGATNWTVTNVAQASCDGATGTPAGSPTASGATSVITISSVTALSNGTIYCWDISNSSTSALVNPTAGTYHPKISETGGVTDSATVALDIISNDQIVVNATVPPTFTFALNSGCGSNQDNFTANLATSGTNTTGGCTWQVDTNAKTGWYAWASDSQTGLHSTAVSKTIASASTNSNTTISNGVEGYVMGVTSVTQGSGAGTTSASNAFGNGSGGTAGSYQGSGLRSSQFDLIASSTGTASAAQFVTKEYATISTVTPAAADYTDTITFIAAGSF